MASPMAARLAVVPLILLSALAAGTPTRPSTLVTPPVPGANNTYPSPIRPGSANEPATKDSNAFPSSGAYGGYIASILGLTKDNPVPATASSSAFTDTNSLSDLLSQQDPSTSATGSSGHDCTTTQGDVCAAGEGTCWDQWYAHWSVSMFPAATASVSYQNYTYTYTKTESQPEIPRKTIAVSELVQTIPIMNGGFTIGYTTATDDGTTYTQTAIKGTTYTTTGLETGAEYTKAHDAAEVKPTCTLQSYEQGCQDWWSSHISFEVNGLTVTTDMFEIASRWADPLHTTPPCTQADVTGELCQSMRGSYMTYIASNTPEPNNYVVNSAGYVSTGFVTENGTEAFGWGWPSTSTLAPGCTPGCAQCAVTAGTIELLYWPASATMQPGQSTMLAYIDDATLTYPTMYVSYSKIHAADSCKPVGPTITNTIIPIPTDAPISSQWASLYDSAWFMPGLPAITEGTASFNITDMNEPVPYSIYSSQPWCQSWLGTNVPVVVNNSGTLSTKRCPTTDPYKPVIYLPSQILNELDPAWAYCSADVRGMYDPPKALTQVEAIAAPTAPSHTPTQSASPSSTPDSPTPRLTTAPISTKPTGNAVVLSPSSSTERVDSGSSATEPGSPSPHPDSPAPSSPMPALSEDVASSSLEPSVRMPLSSQNVGDVVASLIREMTTGSQLPVLSPSVEPSAEASVKPSVNSSMKPPVATTSLQTQTVASEPKSELTSPSSSRPDPATAVPMSSNDTSSSDQELSVGDKPASQNVGDRIVSLIFEIYSASLIPAEPHATHKPSAGSAAVESKTSTDSSETGH